MRSTWTIISGICSIALSLAATGRQPSSGRISRRAMARPLAQSGCRPSRTRFFRRRWPWCLNRSMNRTFLDCSYGFRPGRSAHQALQVWRDQLMHFGGGWVIELDVQRFFDTLDKAQLRASVRPRVRDGALLRLIGQWLNAGVLEDGAVWHPEAGTPQGGVISPLLANIFLHEVLDLRFEQDIK